MESAHGDGAGRVVLGLAGTVDYEVTWDAAVVADLVAEHGIRADELTAEPAAIDDERDLLRCLLFHMAAGTGTERFVASSRIVEAVAAHFEVRITLGGSNVRAALAMAALGVPSTVHLVSIDAHVRRTLPPGVGYLCSATADSTDPHLILQFPAGAAVRVGDVDVRAPHPNRLIFVNDPPSRELVISEQLGELLAGARVVLLSGFNVIQEPAVLADRLEAVRRHLRRLPADGVVVYEEAGFHHPEMAARVRAALLPVIDAISMNEDEMQALVGRPVDLTDPAAVASALVDLRRQLPGPVLVVHTKYWALAYGPDAARWSGALTGGVTMAGTRYRDGDELTPAAYAATAAGPASPVGATFAAALGAHAVEEAVCVPAFDLRVAAPTTIGLGDSFVGGLIRILSLAPAAVAS